MASSEQVTNVGSLMTPTPFTISPNDSAQSAARLMAATGVGILPVEVPGVGAIIGVLTDRDIVVSVLAEGTPLLVRCANLWSSRQKPALLRIAY